MRPRTLKVLYNILYEEFQTCSLHSQENGWIYICHAIEGLEEHNIITKLELKKIQRHFVHQYPTETKYKEFYEHDMFNNNRWSNTSPLLARGWFRHWERDIRIKFLEAILDKLNK